MTIYTNSQQWKKEGSERWPKEEGDEIKIIDLTKRRWQRGWRDLLGLGLSMRRMALNWTLSRRKRVNFRALTVFDLTKCTK